MDNLFNNFLLGILLVLLIWLIIGVVTAFLTVRWLRRFVSPDVTRLQKQFDLLRANHPEHPGSVHLQTIIRRQAFKCGLVGAITGLGGFVTLPITLPIDLLLSTRIQATLVQFIASVYGQSAQGGVATKIQTYLITTGTVEISESSFTLIMKIVLRLLGESLAVFIPAIGALVGFIVNYLVAQGTGRMATRWYGTTGSLFNRN